MASDMSILETLLGSAALQWAFDLKWVEWPGSGGKWAVRNWAGRACSGRHMWWAMSPTSKRCMFVMLPHGACTTDGPYTLHPEHFEPCPSTPEWPCPPCRVGQVSFCTCAKRSGLS